MWNRKLRYAAAIVVVFGLFLIDGWGFIAKWNLGDVEDRPIVWQQLTPGGGIVRAIVAQDAECPIIRVNGKDYPMRRRPPAARRAFPPRLCEFPVTPGQDVRIDDRQFTRAGRLPKKIVVLGDTGCRVTYYERQDCNDAAEWPFAKIAKEAAKHDPDLVIHLGDYHYREAACPDSIGGCKGSPWGDNWETWKADFFDPAAPLLATAPWILVRGNHEDCERAGAGWLHFFAPWVQDQERPDPNCRTLTPTQLIELRTGTKNEVALRILQLDTADAESKYIDEETYQDWTTQLDEKLEKVDSEVVSFVLLHQPLRSVPFRKGTTPICEKGRVPVNKGESLIKTCDAILGLGKKLNRLTVFSGDTHAFQSIPSSSGTPNQLIVGNGGTKLDPETKFDVKEDARNRTYFDFGFMVLERSEEDGWKGQVYSAGGDLQLVCEDLSECKKPES
ncbi:MAG: metallophosphoesterase [Proteobacteria bacterium]|nr:metallophosphoesterase [Pseudomonadota bacterium]